MVLSRIWTRLLFLPQPYRELLIDTISPVNLPVLLDTKRVVGRQVGSYQHQCDWACNLTARWMNHQCKKPHNSWPQAYTYALVPAGEKTGWVDGWKGRSNSWEKKKGFNHTWGKRVDWKFLTSLTLSVVAMIAIRQQLLSSAVFSRKMVVGEFLFWFILMHCSDNQCKCWFTKQITPACLNNGENFSCPNLIHPYGCQGTKSAVDHTWSFTEIHITKQVKSSLFNPSCIKGCLSLLPAVEKCVQADCDILRYAHYSKLFSNWFAECFPCAEPESVL